MGCDIHIYTEKFVEYQIADVEPFWHCCDRFRLNEWRKIDKHEPKWYVDEIYKGRDYTLFAALAGVRNDGSTEVISEPRGLPKDVSKIIKRESDRWGVDGHSHSWLLASELFEYQKKFSTSKWNAESQILVQRSPVDHLVECVKKRMADEFYIFDFLKDEEKEKRFNDAADKFRIVFWFDN